MIDFTGVKALTIPEGKVSRITRKSDGTLIWEAVTSRIPKEYQEVEYINMPSGAYINTGWIPSNDSVFRIKFKVIRGNYFWGCGSNPRLAAAYSEPSIIKVYNPTNSKNGVYQVANVANKAIDIETYTSVEFCSLTIDGNTESRLGDGGGGWNVLYNSALPMLLGAWSYNATTTRHGEMDLYYSKASVSGVDVFEMIPCYRKSDGVIGVYDTVSKTFFTNAGTGSFIKGADI